jgi:hypothetical protein
MGPIQTMLQPIDNDLARLTEKMQPYRYQHSEIAPVFAGVAVSHRTTIQTRGPCGVILSGSAARMSFGRNT